MSTHEPFFFTLPFEKASSNRTLDPRKSRLQGLATLLTTSVHRPWEPLSAPYAHGLSPSELSSHPWIEKKFPSLLPLSRFLPKPPSLELAPQRFLPHRWAVPLSAPSLFTGGRGRVLSWASSTSRVFPPKSLHERLSHSWPLFILLIIRPLDRIIPES